MGNKQVFLEVRFFPVQFYNMDDLDVWKKSQEKKELERSDLVLNII